VAEAEGGPAPRGTGPECGGAPAAGEERRIRADPLDLESLLAETEDPACGALVVFSGTVRNHNRDRRVESLAYEAHRPLAESVLRELEAEVIERFGVRACRIRHRVGRLEPGEPSVYVVVRSDHRDEAFRAGRHAIDELKERLPVWKEESYAEGDRHHLEGTPLRAGPGEGEARDPGEPGEDRSGGQSPGTEPGG